MDAKDLFVSAFIETNPALAERVCYFWRHTRPCESQKWLLGCAFGIAQQWDIIRGYQIEELKFLSRLAGSMIDEQSECMRHTHEAVLESRAAET
jgi:hypothetical protein